MADWQTVSKLIEAGHNCLVLTVTNVKGSAPRDAGTSMIITDSGDHIGTIGGGALEWQATKHARTLLAENQYYLKQDRQLILGPDLEQCCGGVVDLSYELFTVKEKQLVGEKSYQSATAVPKQKLVLFGGGHIGTALVKSLYGHEFNIQWVDTRPYVFPDMVQENITLYPTTQPEQVLNDQPEDTFVLIMTHCHKLDFQIACAALLNNNISFTGLIGSATKKARFVKRFAGQGLTLDQISRLTCPIGIDGIKSKTPQSIAASVTAQLLIEAELVITSNNDKKARAIAQNSRLTNVGGT